MCSLVVVQSVMPGLTLESFPSEIRDKDVPFTTSVKHCAGGRSQGNLGERERIQLGKKEVNYLHL